MNLTEGQRDSWESPAYHHQAFMIIILERLQTNGSSNHNPSSCRSIRKTSPRVVTIFCCETSNDILRIVMKTFILRLLIHCLIKHDQMQSEERETSQFAQISNEEASAELFFICSKKNRVDYSNELFIVSFSQQSQQLCRSCHNKR